MYDLFIPRSLAYIYEQANDEKKKKAEQYFNAWLNIFLNTQSQDAILFEIMNKASAIAKKNGLTPQILEEILADEK